MAELLIAALAWVGIHVGLAGTGLRGVAVRALGTRGFMAGFSLLSVASIVWLVRAYGGAETTPWWIAPTWLRWGLVALMLPACILVVAAYVQHLLGEQARRALAPLGYTRPEYTRPE
jgi:uncharacterized membrane protein